MLAILTKGEGGAWSIGLIPLFVGVVLALFGRLRNGRRCDENDE